MRKFLPLIIAMMICLCPARVWAATGEIHVSLPDEAKELTLYYTKIAEREELDSLEPEELLQNDIAYEECMTVTDLQHATIANLEDGIYKLWVSGDETYEFMPMLVSVPAWNEPESMMDYHVEVMPKYNRHLPEPEPEKEPEPVIPEEVQPPKEEGIIPETKAPTTGDDNVIGKYAGFGVISLIIVVIMTCHNRFKCGRMSK